MQAETYQIFRDALKTKTVEFSYVPERMAEYSVHDVQYKLYAELHQLLSEMSVNKPRAGFADIFVIEFMRKLAEIVTPSTSVDGDKLVVQSLIPVLTTEIVSQLRSRLHHHTFKDDVPIVAFAAALVSEAAPPDSNTISSQQIPISVLIEISSYNAWRAFEDSQNPDLNAFKGVHARIEKELNTFNQQIVDETTNLQAKFVGANNSLEASIATLVETVTQADTSAGITFSKIAALETQVQNIIDTNNTLASEMEKKYSVADGQAKAGLEALIAHGNFDKLKIHWDQRGNSARVAWIVSSVILLCLLVGLPALAIVKDEIVVNFIKELIQAAALDVPVGAGPVAITVATVSRLVIITIPLALYFWLIRLVVRYNMRSMLLMDDAHQRATMLETFYRMIEKQAASPIDRALVLQALMRPAPGHGSDTIEPPNFSEVIDKAMGKGGG